MAATTNLAPVSTGHILNRSDEELAKVEENLKYALALLGSDERIERIIAHIKDENATRELKRREREYRRYNRLPRVKTADGKSSLLVVSKCWVEAQLEGYPILRVRCEADQLVRSLTTLQNHGDKACQTTGGLDLRLYVTSDKDPVFPCIDIAFWTVSGYPKSTLVDYYALLGAACAARRLPDS